MDKETLKKELETYLQESQKFYNMWQQANGAVAYIQHQLEKLEKGEQNNGNE